MRLIFNEKLTSQECRQKHKNVAGVLEASGISRAEQAEQAEKAEQPGSCFFLHSSALAHQGSRLNQAVQPDSA